MESEINELTTTEHIEQEEHEEEKTKTMHKKKNRGTRRQQRYRAKQKLLFLQLSEITAACEQAVANDITKADEKMNEIVTKLHLIQDAATEIKRPSMMIMKRKAEAEAEAAVATAEEAGELMTTTTTLTASDQVIQSFSQLSIVPAAAAASVVSYPKQKKLRVSKYRLGKQQQQQQQQKKRDAAALSLPDYLNVPNRIFKHMIVAASEHLLTTDQNKIIRCWLNNNINMQYIRTYARLLDKLLYLQLKEALWTDYFNIGTAAEDDDSSSGGVWASEVQEKISRQAVMNDSILNNNNNNDDPLSFVINYRRYIDEQLQKTENELNEHLNRFKHRIDSDSSKSQLQTIDFSTILKAFVRKGQHRLNAEFQSKKRLLHFDCLDHQLTKAFFDLKPTKQQIHSAKKIWSATFKQQIAEEQVSILKHRLFCKTLPKTFDNILDHRLLDDLKKNLRPNVIDKDVRATITSRRNKVIGQVKLDMMAIHISTAEATARGHAKIAKEEREKLLLTLSSKNHIKNMDEGAATAAVVNNIINAIQAREENIIKRAQYITASSKTSFVNNNELLLPSSAILEVATSFTNNHLLLLAHGPKYVPKCQSYFSSMIEDIIEREYQRMSSVIVNCLTDNCVSASDERAKLFLMSLKSLLTKLYKAKLPYQLFRRARQEYLLTKQIQHKLHSTCNKIILRRTDKSKVFHLGSCNDYQQKAIIYMNKTCAYEEVVKNGGKCPLVDNLSSVITLLDKLLKNKAINHKQYSVMVPNKDKVELGHLYFLPKPHKIGTPLRPIISSMNGPTIGVSHFLDHLLRPIFDFVAEQTTFINGIDLIRQLEKYRDSGHLRSSTQFITFDVTDLYTMIPRNGALEALGRFLVRNSFKGKIGNLSVDTILKLARLVLDTNYFVYDNKYYRQIKGGAMGSPFTMTLANVYMLEWEQPLIELQQNQGEVYGRYIDDVFMTSNMSVDAIHAQLDWMNKKDAKHIQITYSVGLSAEFLDVHIENCHGSLKTSVFHKPAAEPYVLPYSSDHPRHIHINIPYEALLRAARYCSDVYAFDKERLDIEMILLLNGYPPQFLKRHFNRFFRLNQAMQVSTELDVKQYEKLHQKLLYLPTRREKKMRYQSIFDGGGGKDSSDQLYRNNNDDKLGKKQLWNKKILLLPHTFESGPLLNFKREFRQLWTKFYVYKGSVMKDVRLMITTLTNPSLNDLLVRKKPSRSLLSKMETANTTIATTLLSSAGNEHGHEQ